MFLNKRDSIEIQPVQKTCKQVLWPRFFHRRKKTFKESFGRTFFTHQNTTMKRTRERVVDNHEPILPICSDAIWLIFLTLPTYVWHVARFVAKSWHWFAHQASYANQRPGIPFEKFPSTLFEHSEVTTSLLDFFYNLSGVDEIRLPSFFSTREMVGWYFEKKNLEELNADDFLLMLLKTLTLNDHSEIMKALLANNVTELIKNSPQEWEIKSFWLNVMGLKGVLTTDLDELFWFWVATLPIGGSISKSLKSVLANEEVSRYKRGKNVLRKIVTLAITNNKVDYVKWITKTTFDMFGGMFYRSLVPKNRSVSLIHLMENDLKEAMSIWAESTDRVKISFWFFEMDFFCEEIITKPEPFLVMCRSEIKMESAFVESIVEFHF